MTYISKLIMIRQEIFKQEKKLIFQLSLYEYMKK
jgi:hypothetical protein